MALNEKRNLAHAQHVSSEMPIPKKVAVFNKYVTNRIILPFAGWLPPFAEITHTGRRSGRMYRTPVLAFASEDGFVLALTYGRDVDWVRNLRAAGGVIRQGGERYSLISVDFIGYDEVEAYLPSLICAFLKLLSVEDFMRARK
ncbi:MAG: nitroreductase family deazaflavin-dependent oxidoreductase [Candidatus Bathyarchaeota archaeon]